MENFLEAMVSVRHELWFISDYFLFRSISASFQWKYVIIKKTLDDLIIQIICLQSKNSITRSLTKSQQ